MRAAKVSILVLAGALLIMQGEAWAAPMGTAFTYQGRLENGDGPVTDSCDFEFELFDADVGGFQVGGTEVRDAVSVEDGLFTVTIDFGSGAFNGDARWLGIKVCCPSPSCTLEDLDPLVELTPAPQALRALEGVGPPNTIEVDLATGDVGIGTTIPGEKLDVDGNIHASGTIQAGSSITIDGLTDTITASSGTISFDDEDLVTAGLVESTVAGIKFPDGSLQTTGATSSQWTTSGVDISYTAGGVGIGTTGPFPDIDTTIIKSATLPSARFGLSCAADPATGLIYCFGGHDGAVLDQIVEYDPVGDSLVTKSATLPSGRYGLSCAADAATGRIYCFGGIDNVTGYLAQIVEYDPVSDTLVTKSATLPSGRQSLSCAADPAGTIIYCFGGYDGSNLNQIVRYKTTSDALDIQSAVLPSGRQSLSCAADPAGTFIYCFGGYDGVYLNQIVEYDPVGDSLVTKSAVLPSGRNGLSCAEDSGKIYCFGGFNNVTGPLNQIVEYNPVGDTLVTKSATLPSGRYILSCAADAATGRSYCFGGYDGRFLNQIVEYDTSFQTLLQVGEPGDGTGALANTWSVFSSRPFKRDVEPLSPADYQDILGKVQATDVVRYRYILDARQTPHLGVIAEDSPAEILAPGGKAVSLGDYSAFLLAAIKAQQFELMEKDCRMDGMAFELADTQARVRALEELVANLSHAEEGGAR